MLPNAGAQTAKNKNGNRRGLSYAYPKVTFRTEPWVCDDGAILSAVGATTGTTTTRHSDGSGGVAAAAAWRAVVAVVCGGGTAAQ